MFYKNALVIAVPIMLQQLIQSLVSLIDNFMVSGLGDVSMSGVNVAGQVLFVFVVFLNAICMTGGIFMTQFYGAGDREGMGQAFRYKLILGFAAFVPYYLVCMAFPRQVLLLMLIGNSQAGPILDEAVKYIRIMFFMGIPVTISMCIASSLRDMGKVRIPLYVTIAATLTNTTLNWLLIYGNLGFPKMGVEGAALATVIARILEFVIFAVIYVRTKPEFAVKAADFVKINRKQFKETLVKGSLVLFCEMVWVLSETITTAIYNGRGGADVVSGMASGFAIANLFFDNPDRSCRIRKAEPERGHHLSEHGHTDGAVHAGLGLYEYPAGCRQGRRGYGHGSLRGLFADTVCDDPDGDPAWTVYRGRASLDVRLREAH